MPSRSSQLAAVALAAACTLGFTSRDADAYHTPRRRTTDDTAYTLGDKQIRVGLWKVQFGIDERVTLGSYILPWFILAPNGHAKWGFFERGKLALSFSGGALYADTEALEWVAEELGPAQILAVPLELSGSFRFDDRFTLSLSPAWTLVRVEGTLDTDDLEGAAQGAGDNLQIGSTLEWRLTRVTALTLSARYLIVQRQTLGGDASASPDEFTTVDAASSGNEDYEYKGYYSVALAALFSWRIFNLRLGAGYGNFNIPAINWTLPSKHVFPEVDLYWIWR